VHQKSSFITVSSEPILCRIRCCMVLCHSDVMVLMHHALYFTYSWDLSVGTDVCTGSRPTYTQHVFACLCICWFRIRPIRVHLTFSQTQLAEMVTCQVQYLKRQGLSLQFTQCKQEAANSLPALKPWYYLSIRLSHLQTSQSIETVLLSKLVMRLVQPIMFD